jgi:ATP-dependent helicase HrpA
VVTTIGRASAGVLTDLRSVRSGLESLTAAKFDAAVADMRTQLERLVYPGFLTGLGGDRLADLRRYLQAIERRIEMLPENPRRDLESMARVRRLELDLDELAASVPWSIELEEAMWMLQELRVSLFAQSLGVKGNVSEKRVRRALTAIAAPP